ncbi:MAG: hypothetical protein WBG86_00015 [Polyangiales bacterium]
MTLLNETATRLALACIPFLLALAACNDGGTREPGTVINVGFEDGPGCAQRSAPPEEPDLSIVSPPRFLVDSGDPQNSVGQVVARPGDPIDAEIAVNAATREIAIELVDAWAPEIVIYSDVVQSTGNEVVPVVLFSEETTRGRYFMRLTLCGSDCNERQVLFSTISCDDDTREPGEPCGINAPYQRTVLEAGEVVRVDPTCVDLGSTPTVGSGTVLIQG